MSERPTHGTDAFPFRAPWPVIGVAKAAVLSIMGTWERAPVRLPDKLILLLVLCFLGAAVPAMARGVSEAGRALDTANQLLAEKRYSEALGVALKLIEEHPEVRDRADAIVARVLGMQQEFNKKYKDLLAALSVPDLERARVLAQELRTIDPYPDPLIESTLARADQAVRYRADYLQNGDVLNRAAAALATDRPASALEIYISGLGIGRSEFDAATYGDVLRNEAVLAVSDLQARATEAAGASAVLAAGAATLDSLLAGTLDPSARAAFESSTLAPLRSLPVSADALGAAARRVQSVNASIASSSTAHLDDVWLHLVEQIAFGREGQTEGMLVAAPRVWLPYSILYADKASAAARSSYAEAVKLVDQGAPLPQVEAAFAQVRERNQLAISTASTLPPALPFLLAGSADAARYASALAQVPEYQERGEEAGGYVELARLRQQGAALPDAATATRESAQAGRASVAGLRAALLALASTWNGKAAAWETRKSEGQVVAAQAPSASGLARRLSDDAAVLIPRDAAYAVRVAELETAGFQPALDSAAAIRDRGAALAKGTPSATGEATDRKPGPALAAYQEADKALASLGGDLAAYAKRWNAEQPHVTSTKGLATLLASVQALQGRVSDLQADLASLELQARADLAQALSLRDAGDLRYSKAVADKASADKAYNPDQGVPEPTIYDGIITLLDAAAKAYKSALALEEHPETRKRLDSIPDLQGDANDKAYRIRAGVIYQQIQVGVGQYNKGDLNGALETLDGAKAALALMGIKDPDPTLEYYLKLVNTELGLGSQTIDPVDPLYPNIANLMSQAYGRFADAKQLVSRGTKREDPAVTKLLDESQAKLDIVKEVLPKYLEADMLALYIQELRQGSSAFNKAIDDEVKRYRADLLGGDDTRKRDAYDRLSVILEFLPTTYASLKKPLDDYKQSLIKPLETVDTAKQSESQRLLAQAQGVYRAGDSDTWDQALYYLGLSLAAYPLNQQAEALQRRIRIERGARGDLLVDRDSTHTPLALYRLALRAYTSTDYNTAKIYIDQLLTQMPGFSNKDVLQLKTQVWAKLGI